MIREDSFFFRTEGKPLFGTLFTPAGGKCRGALVIADSLFEEKLWSQRVHANLGRQLADKGIAVLSFDYYGYGLSPGNCSDVDLASLEDDLDSACSLLRMNGAGSIAILGVRWGAVVACRVADRRQDVRHLFLVEPVTDWRSSILKGLRANLAGQYAIFKKTVITRDEIIGELLENGMAVRSDYIMNNIDGYIFSKPFFEQTSSAVLPMKIKNTVRSIRIIRIRDTERDSLEENDELVEGFAAQGEECSSVTIYSQQKYWEYTRIFTSTAPELGREIASTVIVPEEAETGSFSVTGAVAGTSTSIRNGDISEAVVSFDNAEGYRLGGIIYQPPESGARKTGLVFSHGGLIGINGAFRFNTRAARYFAAAGYPCFSFDNHGLGRGQGMIDGIDRRTLFRKIQDGLFADDVVRAVDFFRGRTGDIRIGLFGVCGGSITNIMAHSRSGSVDFSMLLSMPVMLTFPSYVGHKRMTAGYARFYLGLYLRRIFNFRSWLRFFTFKSEYSVIFRSLRVLSVDLFSKMTKIVRPAGKGAAATRPGPGGRSKIKTDQGSPITMSSAYINPEFINSYLDIVRRGERMLFIFGDNDNFKFEFNSYFIERMPAEFGAGRELVDIIEIEHANHMYTLRRWQDIIMVRSLEWLERHGFD